MPEPIASSIAILCPGPSLATFLANPVVHDVFIGVNRAVEGYPCDWWAFNDAETFEAYQPRGLPRLFTSVACAGRIKERAKFDGHLCTLFHEINTTCRSSPAWDSFSLTCAMVLCEHLADTHEQSPVSLTIYGCDWSGCEDWKGDAARIRNVARWKNEQHKYGHVVKWLESRGIGVKRMIPEAA